MAELLWVACPGGVVGDRALLRVVVVPRPDPGPLSASGLAAWPPPELLAAEARVEVHLHADGPGETRVELGPARFAHQAGLWEMAFPGDLAVEPPQRRERTNHRVEVVATGETARKVETTFAKVAANTVITSDPDKRDDDLAALRANVATELRTEWAGKGLPLRSGPGLDTPLPAGERPGFLETYGYVREHPFLMRSLGLVFEVSVSRAALAGRELVSVHWPAAPTALPTVLSPMTWFDPGFRATAPQGEPTVISRGVVALVPDSGTPGPDGAPWTVETVDVEQAGARFTEAARGLAKAGSNAPSAAPPSTLPALRTAGLQLVRHGRQRDFDHQAQRASGRGARASLTDERLTADELVLGYRLDVRKQGGDWLSVHQRRASYFFQDATERVPVGEPTIEEGQLKAYAAVDEGGRSLSGDEIVARWDGWSLSVPRQTPRNRDRSPTPGGRSTRFGWSFEVAPGSLPLLRFGGVYDVRARGVDLAGGALDLDDPTADRSVIERVHYRRHEPVSAPSVLLPDGVDDAALGPGEAVTHLVLRSDPVAGLDPAAFAAVRPEYPVTLTRILLPPVATVTVAEHHGMFEADDLEREEADRRAVSLLREAETSGGFLRDPASGGVAVFPRPHPGELRVSPASLSWAAWPDPAPRTLELRWDDPPPGTPAVDVEDDRVVVRLPPGDQVTLEVSSFLTQGVLDQLALMGVDGLPTVSANAAEVGRHPLLTPSSTLTLVHAVRKPRPPSQRLSEQTRQPGDTALVLNPERSLLGVDPRTTSHLEVVASWEERIDDRERQRVTLTIANIPVGRADTQLREAIRHELGDTKNRKLHYTVTAVGRFRQHFGGSGDNEPEDEENFRSSSPAQLTFTSSSARPAPLGVLSVLPGLDWQTSTSPGVVERRRRGGTLLVELARPWYQTGDGEVLGLVCWTNRPAPQIVPTDLDGSGPDVDEPEDADVPPPPGRPEPALHPFLTEVARDPIWVTRGDPLRWLDASEAAQTVGSPISRVRLPEAGGATAHVLQVTPLFEDDRWVARLDLSSVAASSYRPFVRLSLVRFQPSSLRGLEVSPVYRGDLVQLLPERQLTVRRTSNPGQMPLTGAPTVGEVIVSLAGIRPEGPSPNVTYVALEELRNAPAGAPTSATDLAAFSSEQSILPAWHPVALMSRITDREVRELKLLIPATVRGPLRVRVVERENLGLRPTDIPLFGDFAGTPRYLVFADAVAVPDAP